MRSILVACLFASALASAQERPLPDPQSFLQEVRARLQTDDERQSGYMYVETRRESKLDKEARPVGESVKVFESYPGLPGERRWQRLIAQDGKPLRAAELEKQDRERQQHVVELLERREQESEKDRQNRVRDRDRERANDEATIRDGFAAYHIRMLRREPLDGHDTIVFSLTPRAGFKPQSRDGKWFPHFTGTAWVSESDYELVRLEVEAIDTLSVGGGLLARVHKGTKAAFERRKVNGEVWLPASFSFTASARVLLLKSMRVGGTSEFSNYRKFSVDTAETYASPAPAGK